MWKKCCIANNCSTKPGHGVANERTHIISQSLSQRVSTVSIHDIDSDIGQNPYNYGTEEYYNYHSFSPRAIKPPVIGFRS